MKRLFILLLISFSLFASNVDKFAKEMGFERDYKIALLKSKKENRVLMMVLGADYCPWCRKFEHKTLSSDLIKAHLDKNVVTLVVDKKYDVDSFPSQFKTEFTPRVFFINPKDETIISQTTGYVKKMEFMKKLDEVEKLYVNSQ